MVEQYNYPLIRGEKGINFAKINPGIDMKILTESGERLYCRFDRDLIAIHTPELTPEKHAKLLYASVEEGVLEFGLVTRNPRNDVHKDLFAGEFVDYAMNYFAAQNTPITAVEVNLNRKSNREYMATLGEKGDKVAAVYSTWIMRKIAQHGFTEVNEQDVNVDLKRQMVTARISRPQHSTQSAA